MRTAFSIVDFRPEAFVSGSSSTIEAPCRFPETCRGWILSSSMTLSMPSKPTKIAAASRNQSQDNASPARARDICKVIGKDLTVHSFRSHADSRRLDEQRCCRSDSSCHGMLEIRLAYRALVSPSSHAISPNSHTRASSSSPSSGQSSLCAVSQKKKT